MTETGTTRTSSPVTSPPASTPRRAAAVHDEAARPFSLWVYLAVGVLFGILITKSEVISWFRIQEMFRFQGFHMFGIFATALPTAIVTVQLIKRRQIATIRGEPIVIPPKQLGRGARYAVGGPIFGMGWALTGACPGPLFALLGAGVGPIVVVILAALAGTWTYGLLAPACRIDPAVGARDGARDADRGHRRRGLAEPLRPVLRRRARTLRQARG